MKNVSLLLLTIFISISCINAEENEKISKDNEKFTSVQVDLSKISNFYGKWKISNVHKYRGGLTTGGEAKGYIGQIINIEENEFEFILGEKVDEPVYKYKNINNHLTEGEIPAEETTAFYGYKHERVIVHLYEVFDKDELFSNIEIISKDEILIPFDGWVLILVRS